MKIKLKSILTAPVVGEQIIAFADLNGYHRHICSKLSPEETFVFLSDYYSVAQRSLDGSAGRIVKFIGDAILIVFPSLHANQAMASLRGLKTEVDAFLSVSGYDSRLRVKAHLGVVAAGTVGIGELERFDVFGIAVNQAALLPDGDWVLSDDLRKKTEAEPVATANGPAGPWLI